MERDPVSVPFYTASSGAVVAQKHQATGTKPHILYRKNCPNIANFHHPSCQLLGCSPLPTELMGYSSSVQGKS
jgi:hypothetical protein